MTRVAIFLAAALFASGAFAEPFALTDDSRCGAGNASNGITIGDVTGDAGGSNECWGTFNGNDPTNDGFAIGDHVFDFVSKREDEGIEGADIGLTVSPLGGSAGTWSFDEGALGGDPFLIVLKAGDNPGFAVWLFDGAAADSFSGDWAVAWGPGLSHISVYQGESKEMPVPATPALLGLGLVLARVMRRKP
jgi:hypothetical protein